MPSTDVPTGVAQLVANGLADQHDIVELLARRAVRAGARPLLVETFRDPAQPEPARLRALGRILVETARAEAPVADGGRPAVA